MAYSRGAIVRWTIVGGRRVKMISHWAMLKGRQLRVAMDTNLDVIREEFGRVAYTHKSHEKARELCTRQATVSKWVNIILNALTFGGVLTSIMSENREFLFAALLFATLTAGYTL